MSSSTADPELGVFRRARSLNVLYRGCTFCKQACMRDIFNTKLARDRKFNAWQPITTRLCKKCDIVALEFTSTHGIGWLMNKWMKFALKTQSLLASTPWSHKSHDHPGYRSWFYFSFEHDVAHAFWRPHNNEDGSTCNRCACTWFKTPEQPSSYKASSRQSN